MDVFFWLLTFNNILFMSWWSVLMVMEAEVHGDSLNWKSICSTILRDKQIDNKVEHVL